MPQVITYTTNDPFNDDWGIFLQNEGLGPAFIDFRRVTLDDIEKSGFEIVDDLIQERFIDSRDFALTRYYDEGFTLKAGAKTPVLIFVAHKINKEKGPEFLNLINKRINVEFVWCSMYDECRASCSAISCTRPNDPDKWIEEIKNRNSN